MKRYLTLIVVLIFGLMLCSTGSLRAEGLGEGDKVQNFILADGLTGEKVTFETDIKGKAQVTAIIFANSSCGACRKELTTLSKLTEENEGFKTYVVLVDMKGAEIIEAFSKRFNFNVTYLLDPDFSVPPAYGFYFTPSLVMVDTAGVIIYKKGGYNIKKDKEILTEKLQKLLKK